MEQGRRSLKSRGKGEALEGRGSATEALGGLLIPLEFTAQEDDFP